MKKTFSFNHPKINTDRRIEAIKHEIKKYIKRERRKALPTGMDFWGFSCKFGATEAEVAEIHEAEINKKIDEIHALGLSSFYIEVIAVAQQRTKKPVKDEFEELSGDDDQ